MQLPFLLLGCSVRERTPLLLLQQEFDNAFLFLSLPAVAYAVCAVAATDGGAGKADTVDWHPNSSNKMLALPGLLCYYPGCVYQSWLALQLFGRFMSFPPQAPRMPAVLVLVRALSTLRPHLTTPPRWGVAALLFPSAAWPASGAPWPLLPSPLLRPTGLSTPRQGDRPGPCTSFRGVA